MHAYLARGLVAGCLALALVAIGYSLSSAQQDFSGTYSVSGVAPNGTYTAQADLIPHGPVYEIRWTFPQGDGMRGVGFVDGDRLIIGFAAEGPQGASAGAGVYRVTDTRPMTLAGTWTAWGFTEMGTETLVKGPPAIRARR